MFRSRTARQLAAISLAAASCSALPIAPAHAQGFDALATKDGTDIWSVGAAGTVYRSLDGGATWGSYPLGAANLHGVAARGATVIAVGDSGACYRSANTGFSFAASTLASGANLRSVWMADASTGWIAGAGGAILATSDAGATWAPQTSGTVADLNAIRFTDAQDGWACGTSGTIAHTTDAGATWTASTPFSAARALLTLDVRGDTLAVGGEYAFFATSTNAGASWTERDLRIESRSDIDGVALAPGGALWLSGGGGFLRATTSLGASWTYPLHPIVSGLSDVVFTDAAHGWACAKRSTNVARTTNGGATWSVPGGAPFTYAWSRRKNPGAVTIRGNTLEIDAFNRDKLYVVMGLAVYASWDRGTTWTQIATIGGGGSKTNSFYVSRTDTMAWVAAVGAPDRIAKTTDGGATWTSAIASDFGEYGTPLDRDPNVPENLYFAPLGGALHKSTDFGSTWSVLSTPGFVSPCDVAVLRDTTGIVFISDGTTSSGNARMHRSTDGGLTFSLIYTGTGTEIPALGTSWLDNRIAYSTHWGSGGFRRTGDFGVSWPVVATTSDAWGTDIAKDDPHVSMHGVYAGAVTFLSIDDGATLLDATVLNASNYGILVYDRGTYFALNSNGIYKATTTQTGMPVDNAEILAVGSPNGGEAWAYNSAHAITWTSQNVATARIEYSADAGPWQEIAAAASGPAGSYPWVIPNVPSASVRVRVSDSNDATPIDESDAPFAIVVPSIVAQPGGLDFDDIVVGQSAEDTIRIVNGGTATLVISSVTAASGAYSPSRSSFSVAAGSSDTLAVTFAPGATAAYDDTLVIESNAPDSPTRVPLAGAGLSPVAVVPAPAATSASAARFELRESVPNPFGGGGTMIGYAIPRACDVRLVVYDAAGREVARLVNGLQAAGSYAVRFPDRAAATAAAGGARVGDARAGDGLPSGVYFYRLDAASFADTKRMVLVK